MLRISLSILNWRFVEDASILELYNDFEMSLLRHEDDEIGVVVRVVEMLYDGLHVLGRGLDGAPRGLSYK